MVLINSQTEFVFYYNNKIKTEKHFKYLIFFFKEKKNNFLKLKYLSHPHS